MEPDDFQRAWQAQSSQTRVTIDADLLLDEVQRHERAFRTMIFLRDFREVFVALALIPVWFYLGATMSSLWTWYLTVPALIWIAGFMLAYRWRHPQKPNGPQDTLQECVKNSLSQVENQIWLLRHVFWWYLLPPGIAMSAFFIHVAWHGAVVTHDWVAGLFAAAIFLVIEFAVTYSIYWLNQRAVDAHLEPQRKELLALLTSFGDESMRADDQVSLPALPFGGGSRCGPVSTRTGIVVTVIAVIALMALLVVLVKFIADA